MRLATSVASERRGALAARLYNFAPTRYPPPLLQRRSSDLGTLEPFEI
jgi:hypothetical protein